jgi:hypothetical protein
MAASLISLNVSFQDARKFEEDTMAQALRRALNQPASTAVIKPQAQIRSHWTKVSSNTFVRIRLAFMLMVLRRLDARNRLRTTICRRLPPNGNQYLSTIDAAGHTADDCAVEFHKKGLDRDKLGRVVDVQP